MSKMVTVQLWTLYKTNAHTDNISSVWESRCDKDIKRSIRVDGRKVTGHMVERLLLMNASLHPQGQKRTPEGGPFIRPLQKMNLVVGSGAMLYVVLRSTISIKSNLFMQRAKTLGKDGNNAKRRKSSSRHHQPYSRRRQVLFDKICKNGGMHMVAQDLGTVCIRRVLSSSKLICWQTGRFL